eukprot:3622833-Amphidinium_carterae.1
MMWISTSGTCYGLMCWRRNTMGLRRPFLFVTIECLAHLPFGQSTLHWIVRTLNSSTAGWAAPRSPLTVAKHHVASQQGAWPQTKLGVWDFLCSVTAFDFHLPLSDA